MLPRGWEQQKILFYFVLLFYLFYFISAEATAIFTVAQGNVATGDTQQCAGTTTPTSQPEEQGGRPLEAKSVGDKKEV